MICRKSLEYFDGLVKSNDIKISKNPQGFLYRAVENPDKFSVPFGKKSTQQLMFKRPEHKVFSRKELYSQENNLNVEEFSSVEKRVEKKVSFLRGVLSEDKYKEAYLGCLKEEMKKAGFDTSTSLVHAKGKTNG